MHFRFRKHRKKYLQEILFRAAIAELGVRPPEPIEIDHRLGIIRVAGEEVELLYPSSWFRKMNELPSDKLHRYSFVGAITDSGGRREMLAPYARAGHLVRPVMHQRGPAKGRFDSTYFGILRATEFALCPNHIDWPGPTERAWTYRFIEATLTGAIPVCFRLAPLGERFLGGYHFVWDDEPDSHVYSVEAVRRNLAIALRRHVLPAELVAKWTP